MEERMSLPVLMLFVGLVSMSMPMTCALEKLPVNIKRNTANAFIIMI
jgi:hypothetical protein